MRPPLTGTAWTGDFHIEGRPAEDYGSEAVHETVSSDYFRVLRIPIKSGRAFADTDRRGAIPVVIINEALARRYFGPENPLGKRIAFDKVPDSTSVWRTVVGVVGSVRQTSLSLEPQIQLFVPVGQEPGSYSTLLFAAMMLVVGATMLLRSHWSGIYLHWGYVVLQLGPCLVLSALTVSDLAQSPAGMLAYLGIVPGFVGAIYPLCVVVMLWRR